MSSKEGFLNIYFLLSIFLMEKYSFVGGSDPQDHYILARQMKGKLLLTNSVSGLARSICYHGEPPWPAPQCGDRVDRMWFEYLRHGHIMHTNYTNTPGITKYFTLHLFGATKTVNEKRMCRNESVLTL